MNKPLKQKQISGQNQIPAANKNERPISALLAQYKDNPANRGLILRSEYVPPKQRGQTSVCLM